MAKSESNTKNTEEAENASVSEGDDSLDKAIEIYRKINETEEMSEKKQKEINDACEIIKNRQIITQAVYHEPGEIENITDSISTGPPTLTRFEKARIMGSRALQLSLGAPPFLDFSKDISTSLEIAMEELHQKVIPIVIRRALPNGDYQNISIEQFK